MGDGPAIGEIATQPPRRPLLAGGLLAGAGLMDLLSAWANTLGDPYLVETARGPTVVDITGWAWLHAAVAALVLAASLVVAAGRRGAVPLGLAAAGLSAAIDLLLFPFAPIRAVLVLGFTAAAARLLLRHRRATAAHARAAAVSVPGRSDR
ncbi:hypothetical protein ACFY3U_24925 [Micromonospora sp. NPDC000089]|uniref:DUF7144 family membrane protein n=1 Tax=unclassified Micromonospora TaxID=2617518 RepID=UPI0036A473E7